MHSRIRLDNVAHFADLQAERSILEWFLHFASREESEITSMLSAIPY